MELANAPAALSDQPCPEVSQVDSIRYVFTFVHGTWANSRFFRFLGWMSGSAQWYEEGSNFRSELAKQFPGSLFVIFEWSGANSVVARLEAAKSLASNLGRWLTEYRNAQHFVIGHSHGGNIACYAIQDDPQLSKQIAGVICLSTPFLNIQVRHLSMLGKSHLLGLVCAGMLYTLGWASLKLSTYFNDIYPPNVLIGIVLSSFGGLLWLGTIFKERCAHIQRATDLPSNLLPNCLIVRTAADEASAAMILCQIGLWSLRKVMAILLLPVLVIEWLAGKRKATFVKPLVIISAWLFCLMMLAILSLDYIWPSIAFMPGKHPKPGFEWVVSYYYVFLNSIGLLALGVVVWLVRRNEELMTSLLYLLFILFLTEHGEVDVVVAMVITLTLSALLFTTAALGFKLAPAFIYLEATVEPAPRGRHTICQFGSRGDFEEQVKTSLNHSIAYQSPQIIAAITGWIQTIVAVKKP